jgi:hypothetical protein
LVVFVGLGLTIFILESLIVLRVSSDKYIICIFDSGSGTTTGSTTGSCTVSTTGSGTVSTTVGAAVA